MNDTTTLGGTLGGIGSVPESDDPLAEALHFLRMDGMFYCRSELTGPWGVDMPALPDCLWFHVVTSGRCILIDSQGVEHRVQAGDVVVLPHGSGHQAMDVPSAPCPVVFELEHEYISRQYAILRHGAGGEPTNLICGVVQLGHPAARSLLAMLPEIIHVDAATRNTDWPWLPSLLSLMAAETQTSRPGGETVVTRLCDVLVIQTIRSWIDSDPAAQRGWIGALRDPQIGRAISAIHADPAHDWTVESLARSVAMSRSAFSARFTELVGTSAKQYITEWRMQVAEDMLRGNGDGERTTIAAIAESLGYHSEAAFSRAFKRVTGRAPSHVRRQPDLITMAQGVVAGVGLSPPSDT